MCVTTSHWGVPNTRVATIMMSPKIITIALCTSALTLLIFFHIVVRLLATLPTPAPPVVTLKAYSFRMTSAHTQWFRIVVSLFSDNNVAHTWCTVHITVCSLNHWRTNMNRTKTKPMTRWFCLITTWFPSKTKLGPVINWNHVLFEFSNIDSCSWFLVPSWFFVFG